MAEAEILADAREPTPKTTPDIRPILQAILRTNETLAAQNRELYQLLSSGQNEPSSRWNGPQESSNINLDNLFAAGPRLPWLSLADQLNLQDSNDEIWKGILSLSATRSNDFMEKFFYWERPDRIEMVLSERSRWTSWSYAAAFPELSKFIKQTAMSHRSSCQVWVDDLYTSSEKRSTSYKEYKKNIRVLWNDIKNRVAPPTSQILLGKDNLDRFSVRLFQIVDLSPLVLAAILGSTPQ